MTMSYQVIARKWRPQVFEELTGQEAIARTLQNAITDGRLHHAYIFAGPRGVGKTTTARILAKAVNCVTGPTARPCNECAACQEIARGSSIDVIEIDAASHTGVDNVREVIINSIAIGPARDRSRIFIIDEFHQLSPSAFNALLKTLEEPPGHVLFIMATTELQKVPLTILSRCQVFEFRLIAESKIVERLRLIADVEGINIGDSALRRIARAGEGSMRDAQSAFDQVISFGHHGKEIKDDDVAAALGTVGAEVLVAFADALADQEGRRIIQSLDDLVRRGHDLRTFCRELMTHFRNLLVMKTVGDDRELLPLDDADITMLAKQAERFAEEELVRAFHALTEIEQNIRFSNEPRYQLEVGLVKLAHIGRLRPLAELVSRIEEIEKRLSGVSSPLSVAPSSRSADKGSEPGGKGSRTGDRPLTPSEARPVAAGPPPTVTSERPTSGLDAEQLTDALARRGKMLLIATLEKARAVELVGDSLRIVFPEGAGSYKETLLERTTAQLMETVAQEIVGRKVKLDVSVENAKQTADSERKDQQQLRAQVEGDPVVRSLLKTFKGELVDVVPKEDVH
jgi:DNA polymerase-3 subunit gamma/tau